ncbi:tRNA (cytidine(34)-2'-O)-methyltransferase [Chthonobacter rhizosphaerae]|uniref:tRNA (cytidine(34)-2'-O)-methyltransferase n=1 Tax=Chthonobacter rhizosphaerae TaxID=2735553 RepID=UPI0015EF4156|nr:tRNA (cytidine(34)-2'-O)-methyltransferase [Chthonobacter rhizosphaerae]
MDLALYQPDIPQNTGTLLRLGACLGVPVHVIGPAGFDLSDKALRRAGLDYLDAAVLHRHAGWTAFLDWVEAEGRRIVLATTRSDRPYPAHAFLPGDVLLLGRESAGVPDAVHDRADVRVTIPMRPGLRSINVALAGAMILGEALRQTAALPEPGQPSA